MSIAHTSIALLRGARMAPHAVLNLLRTPAMKTDAAGLLFSIKSFAAAMLAYYIALRIGLPKPFWAILTVYIVSQTSAGASLSRGIHRFVGTLAGAVATVAIVPNFVNEPMACSVVLAGWISFCLYVSLLDRTPRAYAFLLAGYTTSLIGFPSVLDPSAVFDTAVVRVQEISIGILCAVLIHRFVLPKPMTDLFMGKLSVTLRDARLLAKDALDERSTEHDRRDRLHLAGDLLALQGLAAHLSYDSSPATPHRETLRLIHDRLARLLPLSMEVEDRIRALRAKGQAVPKDVMTLLVDIEKWIATPEAVEQERNAIKLIDRARLIQANFEQDATPPGRLTPNLVAHLAEMIGLLQDCDNLGRTIAVGGPTRIAASLYQPRDAIGYVYHRDSWMAARAALGAAVAIIVGCAFWIWSAWPDGGLAVSILGVCCALFANADSPAPNVIKYMVGTIYGVAISIVYSFIILPRVTDYAVLVAVLAPAFLLGGSLQARPPTAFMALGITLTIPILAGLGPAYAGDFAVFLNTTVALFAAIGFAVVSMTLLQTVPTDTAIDRLLRLSRRDVRRRALGLGRPGEADWASLMVDRTALLLPRLQASRRSPADVLNETLGHLRIGHAVGALARMMRRAGSDLGPQGHALLTAVATFIGEERPIPSAETRALLRRIEGLMALVAESAFESRTQWLDRLLDLQFAVGAGGVIREERGS